MMWRLTASVSESCLNALALHVTISDDDSTPADKFVESAGKCHCFPQRVSVVRAFGPQRQHCEVVSKQWHAQCSTFARASFSGNEQVCTLWCACGAV